VVNSLFEGAVPRVCDYVADSGSERQTVTAGIVSASSLPVSALENQREVASRFYP